MNDEQLQPVLEAWFRDREVAPKDVRAGVTQVMADVPRTRQERRGLRFPQFRRTASTLMVASTIEFRPTAMPATNGHSPTTGYAATVRGRTHSMFSPAKAITAGALAFAIGSVVLIAQPFDRNGASVPGAAMDDPGMAPSFFSGTTGDDWIPMEGTSTRRESGVVDNTGEGYTVAWDSNDPRISGTASMVMNETDYREGAKTLAPTGERGTIRTLLLRIVNDGGSWEGPLQYVVWNELATRTDDGVVVTPGEDGWASSAGWLTGTGAYEGLSAYLVWPETDGSSVFRGHITAEGPPAVPELPAE